MTLFEFILVMVSLVLAIGVTHLLQGIMAILRDRQAIALQWVRLVWASSLLLWAVYYWWSLWDFRLADWTYPSFIFVLLAPTSLFAAITLLFSFPGEPSSPVHWKPFEEVRRLFFTVYLVYTVVWSADGWVVGVEPAWNDLRLPQMVTVLIWPNTQ